MQAERGWPGVTFSLKKIEQAGDTYLGIKQSIGFQCDLNIYIQKWDLYLQQILYMSAESGCPVVTFLLKRNLETSWGDTYLDPDGRFSMQSSSLDFLLPLASFF